MIRQVMSHMGGIELYGIVSFLVFFVFFLGMLVWVARLRRGHLEAMGRLPLEDATPGAGTPDRPSDPHIEHSHE
ncbi:MAG: hypothetical protein KF833_22730 [Verrucomicrobiae bacterium]|nr:hypothetical protein [Verrucomicrobiae bacterium]